MQRAAFGRRRSVIRWADEHEAETDMQTNPVIPEAAFLLGVAPQFTVADVVAAATYYRDVLGFENRGFFGEPPVFAMVGRGAVEFFFNQNSEMAGPVRPRTAVGYDAYIHVVGLSHLAEELTRRGAKIVEGPVGRVYGMRELVVEDCHGLRLAFGEDPGHAAQQADAADRPSAGR
jgi:catechol 2,3-dioxygenase-like lactoylglutathione lyase family enzyme